MTAYLDNSATTKPCPEAVQACMDALTVHWGNPSSVHSLGLEAERLLVQARSGVAGALGAEPDRIFFTSGGTEADNWAIFSAAQRLGKRGRHIVTTQVEHHAVLHPMKRLEDLLTFVLPLYAEEGKTSLTLAVGCTGGHHRSVAVTHALTEFIHQQGYPVTENHRDLARGV